VGSHVLLHMTESRARKLLGRSLRLGSHDFLWTPSRHDQRQPGCTKTPLKAD
jgi:hypothetical protein